jgi:hypothetical protein
VLVVVVAGTWLKPNAGALLVDAEDKGYGRTKVIFLNYEEQERLELSLFSEGPTAAMAFWMALSRSSPHD